MPPVKASPFPVRIRQTGVASIEFALLALLMAMMLVGSLLYWRVLQAQQSVTRSAGDGARLVQSLIYGSLPGYDITRNSAGILAAASDVVQKSLQASGIPGGTQQNATVTLNTSVGEARIHVSYRLPPLFGTSDAQTSAHQLGSWALTEPASLQATAVVSYGTNVVKTP